MNATLIYHTPETMDDGISPFDDAISGMIGGKELCIACPYLGRAYLLRMISQVVGWRLVTDLQAWLSSHSDKARSRIVRFILNNSDRIRHCKDLHAKVLIAGTKALTGSANFTNKGITARIEVSVLFDDCEQVEQLRKWFEELWDQTAPVTETDLRAFVATMPPPVSVRSTLTSLPCAFPGVTSTLRQLEVQGRNAPIPLERAATQAELQTSEAVEEVLASKSPLIRQLVEELRRHLESDGANVKTANIPGGNLRHHYKRVNFSDMRLKENCVVLKLRVGQGTVNDSEFKWNKKSAGSVDIGEVRLYPGNPIPGKVIEWIAKAKQFTRGKHG